MTNPHQNGPPGAPGLSLRLGRLPVRIQWGFFLLAGLLGIGLGEPALIVAWVGIVLVSVLLHEVGHAVAFRRFGVRSRVVLHPFGGVTIPDGPVGTRARRVVVALAGPLTGLAVLGVPALLVERSAEVGTTMADLAALVVWVNVGWSMLNLLPILPLDGGQVAREVITAVAPAAGERAARVVSILVAGALAVLAFTQGLLFLGLLAIWLASDSYRWLRSQRDRDAVEVLRAAARALAAGDPDRARGLAASVPTGRGNGLGALARELEAWAALATGDEHGARGLATGLGMAATGHLRAVLVEDDPAEAVNLTVDAWIHGAPVPTTVYVDRLEARGLLATVIDRLLASRAEGIEEVRSRAVDVLARAGRVDEAARLRGG